MPIEETQAKTTVADLLAMDEGVELDFDPPKAVIVLRPAFVSAPEEADSESTPHPESP